MVHSILFTGHMIDAYDRKTPRFPADKETAARATMKQWLLKEIEMVKGVCIGIAGGASGGDILFHELCEELGIPSEIYLALSVKEYKKKSVSFAGKNWEDRFNKLIKSHPVHMLPQATESINGIWEISNLWMLQEALKNGGDNMTLLALWDGKGGDGEGGTEHMVKLAKEAGAKTIIVKLQDL